MQNLILSVFPLGHHVYRLKDHGNDGDGKCREWNPIKLSPASRNDGGNGSDESQEQESSDQPSWIRTLFRDSGGLIKRGRDYAQ